MQSEVSLESSSTWLDNDPQCQVFSRVFSLAKGVLFPLPFVVTEPLKSIMNLRKHSRLLILSFISFATASALRAENWPNWRGPNGDSTTSETAFPTQWDKSENILWKVELPDRGNSSPIVWGNRVFITQAVEKEGRRTVMAFDRETGKLLWQAGTVFRSEEKTHDSNPYCSASPVTDGERVIAGFGSAGIFCFDLNGKELWRKNLGPQEHIWGNASSPVIYKDLCIVYHGPGEASYLAALDKRTGEIVWKVPDLPVVTKGRTDGFKGQEPGIVGSFATPVVLSLDNRDEVVMSFHNQLIGFDPATGKKLWWCDGLNPLIYASPVLGDQLIVAQGGYSGNSIAVKPGGAGDVTQSHRRWLLERDKGGIGSGVIKEDRIYFLNSGSLIACQSLESGETLWEERVAGAGPKASSWSSMILSGNRIYMLNQSGTMIVLRASPKFEVISVNSIGNELTNSTQAMSNGDIFIRTHEHLWCVRSTGKVAVN